MELYEPGPLLQTKKEKRVLINRAWRGGATHLGEESRRIIRVEKLNDDSLVVSVIDYVVEHVVTGRIVGIIRVVRQISKVIKKECAFGVCERSIKT